MSLDLLKDVDFLKSELMGFYRVVRHGDEATAAVVRRQEALRCIEEHVGDPAHLTEQALPQRWGYVQLVSLIETVREELKSLRICHH